MDIMKGLQSLHSSLQTVCLLFFNLATRGVKKSDLLNFRVNGVVSGPSIFCSKSIHAAYQVVLTT